MGSVKPFFSILLKYSDCSGKGHMPEKMGFLPEISANSLLLSVLTLQDNSLSRISLPVSKGHAGCVGSGFICLKLSYQNYTGATAVQPAVTNTLKQGLFPAAAHSFWTTAAAGRGVSWPSPSLPKSLLAAPTTWLHPACPDSAPHTALAFDGLMTHA